jgi:hypothetical protein
VVNRFDAHPQIIEDLKTKAKSLGLWNMFLPKSHFKEGAGFSNLEYGLMAEILGKSVTASEATNCAAPDTGNTEVVAKYGTEEQKAKWLGPLLNGEIRSAFLMTEPQVASSDATNIELDMKKDGDYWVLNGQVCTIATLSSINPLGCSSSNLDNRNGGPAVPATVVARSTLSWANPTQPTRTSIDSSRSSSWPQTPRELPFSECSQSWALTTPRTVMATSRSRTSASTRATWSWAKDEASRSSKAVWAPVGSTMR